MHRSKRKASVRIDYSRLNSLGFDGEEEDGKEATSDMDPSVGDVYDSVNEVGDVRLQKPSGGEVTGKLTPEEMDKELQALTLEQEELKQSMVFQQQKNKVLLMRARALDLRHELEEE